MNGAQLAMVGFGAVLGLGVFLLARAVLVIEQPQLADALARLDGRGGPVPGGPVASGGWARVAGRAGTWAGARLMNVGVPIPTQALALIGWTPEGFLLRKAGMAAFGAAFVPLLSAVLSVVGWRLAAAGGGAGRRVAAAGCWPVLRRGPRRP
jgi:hypothetical protein